MPLEKVDHDYQTWITPLTGSHHLNYVYLYHTEGKKYIFGEERK